VLRVRARAAVGAQEAWGVGLSIRLGGAALKLVGWGWVRGLWGTGGFDLVVLRWFIAPDVYAYGIDWNGLGCRHLDVTGVFA
jgi:hypothetical protein